MQSAVQVVEICVWGKSCDTAGDSKNPVGGEANGGVRKEEMTRKVVVGVVLLG